MTKDLEKLRTQLAAYSERDPVELDKKATETRQAHLDADKFTDQIFAMQGWFKQHLGCGEGGGFLDMLKMLYGDEYDDEEQGLREL